MSRALRIEFDGALYHVMNRGVGRMHTFRDDEDRKKLLEIVEQPVLSGDLVVHAFCLMPNHYHLLFTTPHGGLSRLMRHVNGGYAQAFNRRHRRVGPFWQGRYKALLIDDSQYMLECSRYIHLNPNNAKVTRPAGRYRWSSYKNYVGGRSVVDWVDTDKTLAAFQGDRKKYKAFVKAGKGEKLVSPFESATAGLVLGAESFVEKVRVMLRGQESLEQPALKELRRSGLPSVEALEQATEKIFGDESARRRGRMKLYVLKKYSGLTSTTVALRYNRRHSAVYMAVKAIEEEASASPTLRKRLAQLSRIIEKSNN